MEILKYRLYGILFSILKVFPANEKKVVLYMKHNSNFTDNLRFVYEEMKRRDSSFRFIIVSNKELFQSSSRYFMVKLLKKLKGTMYFFIILNYHFATAEYICLNDNFLPLAYMKLKKDTKLLQFWHGVGAFKRFGLCTEKDESVRSLVAKGNEQVDYLFVSSTGNILHYQEAMGVRPENIHATGLPVTDYYFNEDNLTKARERIYASYPQTKNRKVVLYAPTFRKTPKENDDILMKFDCRQLLKELGEEYLVMIRLHPQIRPQSKDIPEQCIDVSDYIDVKDLYIISDLLITDYSSVAVEYALLNRPMIFYAYDLEQYDRGFYDPYETMVPGAVVRNMEELITAVNDSMSIHFDQRRANFLARHYDYLDGQSTKRVVDLIFGPEKHVKTEDAHRNGTVH